MNQIFQLMKIIDEYEGEGSFLLAGARVQKKFVPSYNQFFYEQLTSIEELITISEMNLALANAGVKESYLNGVQLDFECFQSIFDTEDDGIIPMPTPSDRSVSRHAVFTIGYDEEKGLIAFNNSWGPKWGEKGNGYVSLDYLRLHLKEALVVRQGHIGFTTEKFQKNPIVPYSSTDIKKIWEEKIERDDQSFFFKGKKINIVWYPTIDTANRFIEVFDLRDSEGVRIGWAHLAHCPKNDQELKSIITELFIWPIFRRKGYGTLLEEYCTEYAKGYGSTILEVSIYEMDDIKGGDSPARYFGQKQGYSLTLVNTSLPCRKAYAKKNL